MEKSRAIDLLDNLIGMIEDNQDNDYDTAFRMAIEALKAQLSKEGTTSDLISRTETVEHLRRVLGATVPITDYDEGFVDGVEFGVSTASTMPTIQPQSTTGQLNDGAQSTARSTDLIERQQAIDAAKDWYEGLICGSVNGLIKRLNALPPAQPEPAIPLSWIENEIKWLKSLDNTFSEITALQISAMVKKWRDEKK